MKHNSSQSERLFLDRPLLETPHAARRAASLDLTDLEQTDYLDIVLRAFLTLCLLGSLAVCSPRWTTPAADTNTQATAQSAPTPGVLVETTALPRHWVL